MFPSTSYYIVYFSLLLVILCSSLPVPVCVLSALHCPSMAVRLPAQGSGGEAANHMAYHSEME